VLRDWRLATGNWPEHFGGHAQVSAITPPAATDSEEKSRPKAELSRVKIKSARSFVHFAALRESSYGVDGAQPSIQHDPSRFRE
jgi:hypothetical protein